MNLIISIDNSKLSLTSFIVQSNNFCFDGYKYPFLLEFLDKIYIFSNKELRLSKLIFQMKIKKITNIYRIIPYNISELSIGELDYQSFIYFVEYITSSEFSVHSKLNKLKISLSNTIFYTNKLFFYILKIFEEFPKNMKEISFNTDICIPFKQLNQLLDTTNYNTIENMFITLSKKSLNSKGYEDIKYNLFLLSDNILTDSNYKNLYFVQRTNKTVNNIKSNIMTNISLKYNNNFMEYNIFKALEKFLYPNSKKKYVIEFK